MKDVDGRLDVGTLYVKLLVFNICTERKTCKQPEGGKTEVANGNTKLKLVFCEVKFF